MVNERNIKAEFSARLKEASADAGFVGRGLGKRITDALAEQGVKVSGPAVWKWLNSKSIPDSGNIFALSRWLGVRPEWLEYGRGGKNFDEMHRAQDKIDELLEGVHTAPSKNNETEVPFYKNIELAAKHNNLNNKNYIEETLHFPRAILSKYEILPKDVIAFPVHDDSMSPIIPKGSTVFVSMGYTNIVDGGIYFIEQEDLFRVRLLYRQLGGKLIIRSYNSEEFPDEEADINTVKIIGRVFCWTVMAW
ncbi:phage repressor protein [Xenorhabdus bovienii]|uniref:Phage transcriptional regulator n=1 Tax=Xenorhabdus bovienii str. puntauvense TaxID=1398201 RepID=A0A077NCW0_XENBV|nr:phage repressor protein [Xenorhabdus bovienii]CDG90083.1 Phage transcriptional regulator [Xenorhabdus bovienii str. feltiae France]CDG93663.1 Phage transcriptional regulator [Xenorhabdus bovienii str. feltiae Florida]CDG95760.1 Phage transcriptional regulator [Xenorhabdus bovienii str. puntauvense]